MKKAIEGLSVVCVFHITDILNGLGSGEPKGKNELYLNIRPSF